LDIRKNLIRIIEGEKEDNDELVFALGEALDLIGKALESLEYVDDQTGGEYTNLINSIKADAGGYGYGGGEENISSWLEKLKDEDEDEDEDEDDLKI